jgi:hypothetical protein
MSFRRLKFNWTQLSLDSLESPLENWSWLNWRRGTRAGVFEISSLCLRYKAHDED